MINEMLVIIDPTQDAQPALQRALAIRSTNNTHIHLLLCDFPTEKQISENNLSIRKFKQRFLDNNKSKLKAIVEHYNCGENVSYQTYWNKKWYDAVIQVASQRGSSFIVKSTKKHSRRERLLRKTSDVTLIRQSPCPVLLVNSELKWPEKTIMLAAMDLEKNDSVNEQLNRNILYTINRLQQQLDIKTFIVSATKNDPEQLYNVKIAEELQAKIKEKLGVDNQHIIIKKGSPATVVIETSNEIEASILVIGSVARDGLKAIVVGNTAEKILDQCNTDLLIVN